MKHINVVNPIMDNVIRFERRRVWRWIVRFIVIFGIMMALLILSLYILAHSLLEEEVVLLLSLYTQDVSMFKRFWKEALFFVWDVVPHGVVYGAIALIAFLIVLFFVTRRNRRIVSKRLKAILDYHRKIGYKR